MKNLKVGIVIEFGQKYLPTKKHKIPRVRHLVTVRDIEFKKIDIKDFPIAFIVQDYFSVYEGDTWEEYLKNRETSNGDYRQMDIEIRTYGGKLYKARRFNYGAAIGTGFPDIDDAIKGVRYMGRRMSWYDHKEYTYISQDANFDRDKSIKLEDNLEQRICELQSKADQYIFSDGKIWEECDEPMYMVNTFGLGHNHGGTGMFIEEHYNSNIPAKNYFNALEREEAIRYANEVAARRGDTNDIGKFGKLNNIIVKIPEMVKANPKKDHADGGDEFLGMLESIVENSSTSAEAGFGVIAATLASIA